MINYKKKAYNINQVKIQCKNKLKPLKGINKSLKNRNKKKKDLKNSNANNKSSKNNNN